MRGVLQPCKVNPYVLRNTTGGHKKNLHLCRVGCCDFPNVLRGSLSQIVLLPCRFSDEGYDSQGQLLSVGAYH
jgi:hypothetical protein